MSSWVDDKNKNLINCNQYNSKVSPRNIIYKSRVLRTWVDLIYEKVLYQMYNKLYIQMDHLQNLSLYTTTNRYFVQEYTLSDGGMTTSIPLRNDGTHRTNIATIETIAWR